MSQILALAIKNNPTLEMDAVEAYGMEPAPLVNYVSHSKKIASEYVIKTGGRKYRVYSWLADAGLQAMYILKGGTETILSVHVEDMLTKGNPSYERLTPVAQAVTLV